jgi:hypothetical protein
MLCSENSQIYQNLTLVSTLGLLQYINHDISIHFGKHSTNLTIWHPPSIPHSLTSLLHLWPISNQPLNLMHLWRSMEDLIGVSNMVRIPPILSEDNLQPYLYIQFGQRA